MNRIGCKGSLSAMQRGHGTPVSSIAVRIAHAFDIARITNPFSDKRRVAKIHIPRADDIMYSALCLFSSHAHAGIHASGSLRHATPCAVCARDNTPDFEAMIEARSSEGSGVSELKPTGRRRASPILTSTPSCLYPYFTHPSFPLPRGKSRPLSSSRVFWTFLLKRMRAARCSSARKLS